MTILENPKTKLYAQNSQYGLDIYINSSGKLHYITTRRPNGILYLWLKSGVSLGELKRFRPRYVRIDQKRHHHARYLLRLVDEWGSGSGASLL